MLSCNKSCKVHQAEYHTAMSWGKLVRQGDENQVKLLQLIVNSNRQTKPMTIMGNIKKESTAVHM